MNGRAQKLSSVFYRRGDLLEFIKAGAAFRRILADRTVETAKVRDLYADLYGIPHMRYELTIKRPGRQPDPTGPRTMALKVFCQTVAERL
jgi:hypothetical protein